jgi:CheY-like chemotaxis protein
VGHGARWKRATESSSCARDSRFDRAHRARRPRIGFVWTVPDDQSADGTRDAFLKEQENQVSTVDLAGSTDERATGDADATFRAAPRRRRVLVVEDDAEMRGLLAAVLKKDGADVVEGNDGEELLHWAERVGSQPRRQVFDAIVSDIQMPDLTALDVLRRVPRMSRSAPLILITAFGDKRTSEEAYQLGAEMVLRKPVHLEDFRAIMRSVVRCAA